MWLSGQKYVFFNVFSQEIFPRNLETYVALCGATELSNPAYSILSQVNSQSFQCGLRNNAVPPYCKIACYHHWHLKEMQVFVLFRGNSY